MYAAKKAGKNCWRFYGKSMQVEAYEKVLLTTSLHHALDRGELLLHYQPLVSVNSGAVVGFEALLRWNSAEYGLISPLRFIPLAEKCGIIHSIGAWVLREACRFARGLADQGWEHISVAVNVSPYQLGSDCFVDIVRDSLSEFGVLPGQLKLEITETAFIASLEESIHKLKQLQAIGVSLALDDFGTGYSSLTYLQHLPVQTLKIDKSFIDMISVAGPNKAIIGNVINMAHIMELTVVAEGVETQEQFDYLTGCGCDVIQGYLFCRPVPEEDAVRYLSFRPIQGM
jgi:EAL domain-containing protein (putative c-di-GMP-specific phosphodiesterase class I)